MPRETGSHPASASASELFAPEEIVILTEEQEKYKRAIYEKMNPRRRKFVDKIGYEQWNPFQEPKEPLDMRRDRTKRTLQELVRDFMRDENGAHRSREWQAGAMECAMGIIKKEEKYQGIFDFCLWYQRMLEKDRNCSGA